MKRSIAATVFVVLCLTGDARVGAKPAATTGPAHLSQARAALDELDYDRARTALDAALRVGDLDRRSLVAVYRLSGQVAAIFGDAGRAFDHYARMLALDPAATLPDGLAPKLVSPFDRARGKMKGNKALTVSVKVEGRTRVRAVVAGDPLSMAHGVVASFRQPGTERRVRARVVDGRAVVRVPEDVDRKFRVSLVDRSGNELSRREARLPAPAAIPVAAPAPTPAKPESPRPVAVVVPSSSQSSSPLHARWQVWGVAALGSGAVAVYFGRKAFDDWDRLDQVIGNSSSYEFQHARDLETSGRRNQLLSNIGIGAAVGFGAVATYLLVRKSLRGEKRRIVPRVTPRGGAVVIQGVFR